MKSFLSTNYNNNYFLFLVRESTPATLGSARTNAKERSRRRKEGSEKMEGKYLNRVTPGLSSMNAKERKLRRAKKRKGSRQRVKLPTLSRATDALIGDEEQEEKQ